MTKRCAKYLPLALFFVPLTLLCLCQPLLTLLVGSLSVKSGTVLFEPLTCGEQTLGTPVTIPESGMLCVGQTVTISFPGSSNLPNGDSIELRIDGSPDFDPYTSGVSIGAIPIQYNCSTCASLLGIMVDPCAGSTDELDNEFLVMHSGCGFAVNDLVVDFDANNNTGPLENSDIDGMACGFMMPNAALITTLEMASNCSGVNIIPAAAGDDIPAGVVVIVFTDASAGTSVDWNFNTLCSTGLDIYLLQSSCNRSFGAFSNGGCGGTTRTYAIDVGACSDAITYQCAIAAAPDNSHTVFVFEDGSALLSDNCTAPPLDGIDIPVINNSLQPFDFIIPQSLCANPGAINSWYISAIVDQDGSPCDNVIQTDPLNLQLVLSCIEIVDVQSSNACAGSSTGEVLLSVSGGSFPYSYDWDNLATEMNDDFDGNGASVDPPNVTGLGPGVYCVTVSDHNACTLDTCVVLIEAPPMTIDFLHDTIILECNGDSDGVAEISDIIGNLFSNFIYDWDWDGTPGINDNIGGPPDPTDDDEDPTGLQAGTYQVTVTEYTIVGSGMVVGCEATDSIVVLEPESLVLSAVGETISCFGGNDGEIDLTVTGGITPYSYDWDNDGPDNPDDDIQDLTGLTAGIYVVTVTDANNCSATASANILEPGLPLTGSINRTICENDSVQVDGNWYHATGIYTDTMFGGAINGCDSILTIEITEVQNILATWQGEFCKGDSVEVFGLWYTAAGMYTDTVHDASPSGCDSIYTITITQLSDENGHVDGTFCAGESVVVLGTEYSDPGEYLDTVVGVGSTGCDSIYTVRITEYYPDTSTATGCYCTGDSVRVFGKWYRNEGIFIDTIPGAASNGCDSVYSIVITELIRYTDNIAASFCPGDSVELFNTWYQATGLYFDTIPNVLPGGCDSIYTIVITEASNEPATISAGYCEGDSVQVLGTWYKSDGVFMDTVMTAASGGCDSVYTIKITEIPKVVTQFDTSVCGGEAVLINGQEFTPVDPIGVDTLVTAKGCDSVVFVSVFFEDLEVTILPTGPLCLTGPAVALNAVPSGGLWSKAVHDGQLDPAILGAGDHEITYTVALNACVDADTQVIIIYNIEMACEELQPESDTEASDGTAIIDFVGGVAPYLITWTPVDDSVVAVPGKVSIDRLTAGDYLVTVSDSLGCFAECAFTIASSACDVHGDDEVDIFVPNIFSPNADGINDIFVVAATDKVEEILELLIFDRWGELVFEKRNFPPGQLDYGWDGKFHGKNMVPGVFVYKLKAKLADTSEVQMFGDVTLIY